MQAQPSLVQTSMAKHNENGLKLTFFFLIVLWVLVFLKRRKNEPKL